MLNDKGQVIYVGKAKNLKARVTSYFASVKTAAIDMKTQQLVKLIADVEITVTKNEVEALLLECQLIKSIKPKYNVIFKDDKSFPYILITNETFPQLTSYRVKKLQTVQLANNYYGPYPSVNAIKQTLDLLHKIFKLRQCDNNYFKNRTRPCLQYQIKRCSAPCCGYISQADYQQDIVNAKLFLSGNSYKLIDDLVSKMQQAAANQQYELAAKLRDQIQALQLVASNKLIFDTKAVASLDILGVAQCGQHCCIHLITVREGRIIGSRQYFPKQGQAQLGQELLTAFILQHYFVFDTSHHEANLAIPAEIISNVNLDDVNLLTLAWQQQLQKAIKITCKPRQAEKKKLLKMATASAEQALLSKIGAKQQLQQAFLELEKNLNLADNLHKSIQRIECFDVSHTQGELMLAACVVFTAEVGALKSEYKRFNIARSNNGDDYQAMREALTRHFSTGSVVLPDLLIIDGGKGQLSVAEAVLAKLQLQSVIRLLGVAKGQGRKPGLEQLYLSSKGQQLNLSPSSASFRLILQIRDEAHRFAITGHRKQLIKRGTNSVLNNIAGVGLQRRKKLLEQLGGFSGLMNASIEEISAVSGISLKLAQKIYGTLHGS